MGIHERQPIVTKNTRQKMRHNMKFKEKIAGFTENIRKKWSREKGSLVVESTLVYPVIFFVIMFLLYMGNMYYLKASIDSEVSKEAIRYAALYADPHLDEFEQDTIPTKASEHTVTGELYRYINIFSDGKSGAAGTAEKNDLIGRLSQTGFFDKMEPSCITVKKHEVNNYIVYQTYEVEVSYDLKMPIGVLGGGEIATLKMTSREEAPVTDTSEFIRTVDMAVDYAERSKSGEKFVATINEVYGKVDDFVNGRTYDPSEAVAGGAPPGGPKVTSSLEYAEKVSDRTTVEGTYAESYTESKILKEELYDAGVSSPPYRFAAHHIVPWNDPRTSRARDILDKYDIDYNSAANGVFLPMEKNKYTGNTTLHIGNHGESYATTINSRILEADKEYGTKDAIIKELNSIREELLNGTLQLNDPKK